METFNKLDNIKYFSQKYNKFNILSLTFYNNFIANGIQKNIFEPKLYKNKEIFVEYTIESEDGEINYNTKLDIYDASRKILTFIRDNHSIKIDVIFKEYKDKSRIFIIIRWHFVENKVLDYKDIHFIIKNYIRKRKEEKDWDYDSFIWPKFTRICTQKYIAKEICNAIVNDNIEFIRVVLTDGLYDDFLLGVKWNPIRLICNKKDFSSVPLDDFGEFNPYESGLTICAKHNSINCLELLLSWNANPNYQNNYGKTALHIACEQDHFDCVRILLIYGASKIMIDNFGYTALKYAKIKNSIISEATINKFNNY